MRGFAVSYREIPYKRLQFRLMDTVNNECLHELIVIDANHRSKEEMQTAYKIFAMQVKEMQ